MHDELDTKFRAALDELHPALEDLEPDWERIVADAAPRRRRRGPLAVAVAAAGLLAIGLLPGESVRPASAVERAAAALAPADGTILHTVTITTTGDRAGRTETWQETSHPYDYRQVTYFRGGTRETASANGRPQAYLSTTNTISTLPPGEEAPAPSPIDTVEKRLTDHMLELLRSGEAREAGRVGDAIRIVATEQEMSMLVDAQTFRPIELRTVGENPRAVVTTRFETYERLPATAANRALLSLRAQHPDARTDHGISIDPPRPEGA
jgi:hypothetical protein